jgi:hypothetical protein
MAGNDGDDLRHSTRVFRWQNVIGSWPRRLVHVPTRTSRERLEGNFYGHDKEPKYGIITYTWGRYPGSREPHIDIKNVPWEIPTVSSDHFTADQFEQIIKRVGEKVNYVWVDIACIDQENEAAKMDEIRNQIAIFAKAERVYVWLSRSVTATLVDILNNIFICEMYLHNRDEGALGNNLADSYSALAVSLRTLFKDPWFSSLWTLQEGTLRSDALLLSREGHSIEHPLVPGVPITFGILLNAFWHVRAAGIYAVLDGISETGAASEVVALIATAGYNYTPFNRNPNIQYGAALCRETTRPLDRIFGIMAIYGIRIETPPGLQYTFKTLEHEFANLVNERSPRLGQLYVHTRRPEPHCSWKLTQHCRIPDEIGFWDSNGLDSCTISARTSIGAAFEGPICELHSLLTLWHAALVPYPGRKLEAFWCHMLVDDYVLEEFPILPRVETYPFDISTETRDRFLPIGRVLLEVFGHDVLKVMKLGEQPVVNATLAVIGLVLLPIDGPEPGYRRLGLCQWEKYIPHHRQGPTWTSERGIIY